MCMRPDYSVVRTKTNQANQPTPTPRPRPTKIAVMEMNKAFRLSLFEKMIISVFLMFSVWAGLPFVECSECSLPAAWDGKWFIDAFANNPPILINSTSNSITRLNTDPGDALGKCVWMNKKEDLYIFKNEENCSKCVLIYDKHRNVLQSREALECDQGWDLDDPDHPDIESRCYDKLHESRLHFSWFRKDYKPSDCPFSYRRSGGSNCTAPISHASSCFDRTKLQFRYEGCHDVENSEGKIQDLTCLGDWKEAGYRYFVADTKDLNNRGHRSLNDRLRCFIVNEVTAPNPLPSMPDVTVGYEVGTSESATCQGLRSPDTAETILHLSIENVNEVNKPCSFPTWFASHIWVDMGKTVEFHINPQLKNRSVHIIPKTYNQVTPESDLFHQRQQQQSSKSSSFFPLSHSSLVCMQKTNISEGNDSHVAVVGKYTVGCKIDEICLHLIRRSEYLLQVYYFEKGDLSKESFREKCFASTIKELNNGATFISTTGKRKECPSPGIYSILNKSSEMTSTDDDPASKAMENIFKVQNVEWSVACKDSETVQVQLSPNDVLPENFSCMDGWEEDNITYTVLELVTESKLTSHNAKLGCMISRKPEDPTSQAKLYVTTQDCICIDDSNRTNATTESEEGDSEDETNSFDGHTDPSGPLFEPTHHVELVKHGPCISQEESDNSSPVPGKDESEDDNDNSSELKGSSDNDNSASTHVFPRPKTVLISSLTSVIILIHLIYNN